MAKIKEEYNLLELHPVINSEFETENGLISILVPKFTNRYLVKYLVPRIKKKFLKVNLDETGSAVWALIDGKKNTREIALAVKAKFGEEFVQPEERVSKFLAELHKGKVINFIEFRKGE